MSLAGLCAVVSCRNLIGLDGYSVADDSAGNGNGNGAGTGNTGGSGVEGGGAGMEVGEGGTSGAPEDNGGAAGASGSSETSGSAGASGSTETSGSAGGGGGPAACPAGCDDTNDCTADSCVLGSCAHDALPLGSACGVARICDAQSLCVRCRDTAAGVAQDAGCSPSAPICIGTGLDAACGGCTGPADCNDGNECTTETCTAAKCVFATVAAGSPCTAGVCNGTASMEKCVACSDTASGPTQDAGCTSAKPVCDASGTPTCYECLTSADCASDSVSCTVETCTNHVCSHVATDSQCAASGNVCKPNKCDLVAPAGCKQVDITTFPSIISTAVDGGNGGFEAVTAEPPPPTPNTDVTADGWLETGNYYIIYKCGSGGCAGGNGATFPQTPIAVGGSVIAWTGSQTSSGVTELYRPISFPAGTTTVQVLIDTNFQTKSTATTNHDYFEVRLLDSAQVQIGAPLIALSNTTAQTNSARAWTKDVTMIPREVSAYAGKPGYLMLWTSVDTSSRTDFFFDNVRLIATVCK